MKTFDENPLNPQEDLKASNELMKLKLELEHKMIISDTAGLSPEIENQWLNNIYEFEKQYKEGGRAKVYELLGKPPFIKYDILNEDQMQEELLRLQDLMEEKGITLDCCCEYEAKVIYRFITEELFEHETDNISMEGMAHHFLYEEFHPNHDYDLRRLTSCFFGNILSKKWDEEYDPYKLTKIVFFQGKEHTRVGISSMVLAFQEAHTHLAVEEIRIGNMTVDIANNWAAVEAQIDYSACTPHGKPGSVRGKCTINFAHENEYWSIRSFVLPGFGN